MPIPAHIFPLSHRDYQCCHSQHLRRVPNTRNTEVTGSGLLAAPTLTITAVRDFTEIVCVWGGRTGHRILGRIRREHDHIVLTSFKNTRDILKSGNIAQAISSIQNINGLGQFSYSSKHLRMLAPDKCAVFDSLVEGLIRPHMPHASRLRMFLDYCDFCQNKAVDLTNNGIKLGDFASQCVKSEAEAEIDATGSQSKWTAADVDMAIFAWIQQWCCVGKNMDQDRALHTEKEKKFSAEKQTSQHSTQKQPDSTKKSVLYLCQNHQLDQAVTIKENCDSNWNNAWICRTHGRLDFKEKGARGTTVYMIGEIQKHNVDVTIDKRWVASLNAQTCHHAGVAYQGGLKLGSVANAVAYLNQFFIIKACSCNKTETQEWIDAQKG